MASSGSLAVLVALRSLRAAAGLRAAVGIPSALQGASSRSCASVQPCRGLNERARRVYDYPKDEQGDILIQELGDKEAGGQTLEDEMEAPDDAADVIPDESMKKNMSKVLEQQMSAKLVEEEQHRKCSSAELSFFGISSQPFPEEVDKVLMATVKEEDVELKPDGTIYLPEIKYRRILHKAFGPGGWALMPRGEPKQYQNEGANLVTREYALFCRGRFISQSVGEHVFYAKNDLSFGRALESAKSNALMRCCKDLGIASELWDPQYVTAWKARHGVEVWCENARTKEKKKLWKRKNAKAALPYPWKESKNIQH